MHANVLHFQQDLKGLKLWTRSAFQYFSAIYLHVQIICAAKWCQGRGYHCQADKRSSHSWCVSGQEAADFFYMSILSCKVACCWMNLWGILVCTDTYSYRNALVLAHASSSPVNPLHCLCRPKEQKPKPAEPKRILVTSVWMSGHDGIKMCRNKLTILAWRWYYHILYLLFSLLVYIKPWLYFS